MQTRSPDEKHFSFIKVVSLRQVTNGLTHWGSGDMHTIYGAESTGYPAQGFAH